MQSGTPEPRFDRFVAPSTRRPVGQIAERPFATRSACPNSARSTHCPVRDTPTSPSKPSNVASDAPKRNVRLLHQTWGEVRPNVGPLVIDVSRVWRPNNTETAPEQVSCTLKAIKPVPFAYLAACVRRLAYEFFFQWRGG